MALVAASRALVVPNRGASSSRRCRITCPLASPSATYVVLPATIRTTNHNAGRQLLRQQRSVRATVAFAVRASAAGAVQSTPASSSDNTGMLKFYAAFLLFGCAVNTIGPMLPSLAVHLDISTVDMGPMLSAKGLGGLAGSFIAPLFPLGLMMPAGLLGISASFAAIPFASNLLQMSLIYSFAAAVYQAVSIAAHTLIAQQHGDRAGPHLNGINALFGAGSLLAPVVHSTLSPALEPFGPLASYYVIAAAAAAAAIPFLRPSLALSSAKGAVSPVKEAPAVAPWGAAQLQVVVFAMAFVALNVGAENCFGTWLYTYAAETLALSAASSAAVVSAFWGAFTSGRLLAIPISARIDPATILLGSLPLAVAGPALALALPESGVALGAAAILAGLGLSTGFANAVSLLARYLPPNGFVQALIQIAATAGYTIFPPLVAAIGASETMPFGVEAFLWLAVACAAVDIALVLALRFSGRNLLAAPTPVKAKAPPPQGNAAEAQAWIEAWKSNLSSASNKTLAPKVVTVPAAGDENAADAQAWIDQWKKSQ